MVLGVSLVGSISTMVATMYTPPDRPIQKHLFWLVCGWSLRISNRTIVNTNYLVICQAFNACQAATLSPLFFLSPAILSRAALYTVGVVGSISYIGATATYVPPGLDADVFWYLFSNDKYLHLGGPLLAGVTVVALSSLAPMVLPMGLRSLALAESVSLYGGLAVFGGFVLYEWVLVYSFCLRFIPIFLSALRRFWNMLGWLRRVFTLWTLSMNLFHLNWTCSTYCKK